MALSSWLGRASMGACVILSMAGSAAAQVDDSPDMGNSYEAYQAQQALLAATDARAPINYGAGVGIGKPRGRSVAFASTAVARAQAMATAAPFGASDADVNGYYAPPAAWPLLPIHVALLPDGRVMSFGTDSNGIRFTDTKLYFDVWDPKLGTGSGSHMQIVNGTSTDIFCSYQTLVASTGNLMTVGGDLRPIRRTNDSTAAVTLFNAATNTISAAPPMVFPRWYATLVAMPNGDMVAMGGRARHAGAVTISVPTPEVLRQGQPWQPLTTATSSPVFFDKLDWFYPRAVVAPNGLIFIMTFPGDTYWLDPSGQGTLTRAGHISPSNDASPLAVFAPGKVLTLRGANSAYVVDLNGSTPVAKQTASISQTRFWSNATVLADGQVLVNGGSSVNNTLNGVAYQNEIWDPTSGKWSQTGAVAKIPRLYHSVALLLTDGSVLTAGGGTPGPVKELNAEIFYPPYLYLKGGSGVAAPRPSLGVLGSGVTMPGQTVTFQVGASDQISRMTLVKFGSTTHSLNIEQRFMELPFTSLPNQQLSAILPADGNVLTPGFYMVFAFNAAGTPSVAATIQVLQPLAPHAVKVSAVAG